MLYLAGAKAINKMFNINFQPFHLAGWWEGEVEHLCDLERGAKKFGWLVHLQLFFLDA